MMKCLIVDDEQLARERMERLLRSIEGCEIIGRAENGIEALKKTQELSPDVVLLDIAMPEINGLEVASHLNQLDHTPAIIFCTAFDEHALAAFDANAVDYLVKPIRLERLREALTKAKRYDHAKLTKIQFEQELSGRKHICARVRGSIELVPIEKVIYFYAEHKYITVHYEGGRVLIEESLKALEQEYEEHFIRVHRNALVAKRKIMALKKDLDGHYYIELKDIDKQLMVSRRNLSKIRKLIRELGE